MWLIGLAVIAAFIVGCNGIGVQIPGDGRLVIVSYDPNFNTNYLPDGRSESEALREGVRFWNSLGAKVLPEGDTNEIPVATFHLSRDNFSWPGLANPSTGVTWPNCSNATIYPNALKTNDDYNFEGFRANIAHEVGHAIGLYHITNRGVMHPLIGWSAEYPSAEDTAEYRRIWRPKTT